MACDLSDPEIAQAYSRILSGDNIDWMIIGYGETRDKLQVYSTGSEGVEEMSAGLPDEVVFGFIHFEGSNVLVTHVSERVGGVRRARGLAHQKEISNYFEQHDVTVNTSKPSELTRTMIRSKTRHLVIKTLPKKATGFSMDRLDGSVSPSNLRNSIWANDTTPSITSETIRSIDSSARDDSSLSDGASSHNFNNSSEHDNIKSEVFSDIDDIDIDDTRSQDEDSNMLQGHHKNNDVAKTNEHDMSKLSTNNTFGEYEGPIQEISKHVSDIMFDDLSALHCNSQQTVDMHRSANDSAFSVNTQDMGDSTLSSDSMNDCVGSVVTPVRIESVQSVKKTSSSISSQSQTTSATMVRRDSRYSMHRRSSSGANSIPSMVHHHTLPQPVQISGSRHSSGNRTAELYTKPHSNQRKSRSVSISCLSLPEHSNMNSVVERILAQREKTVAMAQNLGIFGDKYFKCLRGFMTLQEPTSAFWKRRYFVVTDGVIFTYINECSRVPTGSINLSSITTQPRDTTDEVLLSNSIGFNTNSGEYMMYFDSERIKDRVVEEIESFLPKVAK